ncbi:hypothetical protein PIB30_068038, partial [Stylosanthes scabra]|nr:hypothetical protein [Stylosanthes scabra]
SWSKTSMHHRKVAEACTIIMLLDMLMPFEFIVACITIDGVLRFTKELEELGPYMGARVSICEFGREKQASEPQLGSGNG